MSVEGKPMSTKTTLNIQWTDQGHVGFHLYEEAFQKADDPVYLELNGCHFTARSGEGGLPNIEIEIPHELATAMGLLAKK